MRIPYGRLMLLILTGCILGLGIRFYGNLKMFSGTAGFYYKEEMITREQVQDFWKEASPETQREVQDIVLFRSKSGKEIFNPNLNRTVKGEVIEVAGNMNLIMPGSLMMGSFVSDSDDRGCVISRKTAEELYSSYEVLGNVVRMENKNYYIRGILDVNYEICMIQGGSAAAYPKIRVNAPRLPLSVMEQQLAGILPAEYDKISEGDLYQGIGGILFWIPGWVLLYFIIGFCRKGLKILAAKEWNHGWQIRVLEIMKWGLIILDFAGSCGILFASLHFSDDYIPSAWSDFSFWIELCEGKWGEFLSLLSGRLLYCDGKMLGNLAGVAVTSIVEGFLIGIGAQGLVKKILQPLETIERDC